MLFKKEVGVKDFNDIRIVNKTTYVEKYVCGTEFKTIEEYEKEKDVLLSKRKITYEDKYDTEYEWESLEDEFAYRKFVQQWIPIEKTIQIISDPIEIEVKKVKTESGNKFITSLFLNGMDKDLTLFIYDRPFAVKSIVTECFTELGMTYEDNKNYGVTEGKKIWSNSTHSCIRYVVAFGTYIFDDKWDVRNQPKGTLKDLLSQYENDRNTLRKIITTKYNNHFGRIEQGNFDFQELLSKLNTACNTMRKVKPKQNSILDYNTSFKKIQESIEMIENAYKV